jgi:xanthine dehydrogenase accessory factor
MDAHSLFKEALKSEKIGQKYCFATIIEATLKGTPQKSGAKMLILEDGTSFGTIGGGRNENAAQKECLKAIKSKESKVITYDYFGQKGQSICGGQIKVYIEPFIEKKELIICGGGHIGLALSLITKLLNYKITILDNRKAFCNNSRFSHVNNLLLGNYENKLGKINITQNTYIMIVTQGNEYDYTCLKKVINSNAAYIGVISSKSKKIKFFERLKKEIKATPKILKRIHIPAGIDIGAQTPEEIAISITAEIIKIDKKNHLNTDKFKEKLKLKG